MLDIRYEDEALLIVEKPPGMLTHPIAGEDTSLASEIRKYYNNRGWNLGLHPVSRLDRHTSGLVVFAKLPEIQGILIKQGMQKEYLALVTGTFPASHGVIELPIARKPGSIIEREISPDGKPAKTEYWVIPPTQNTEAPQPLSLVRCRLYTGRTHQIRVHFAGIGCPLWHDNLYGNIPGPPVRHGLHSYKIAFLHPWTRVHLEVISLLPADMRSAWLASLKGDIHCL